MSKHCIIYIPGIGDHRPYFQPQILKFWQLFGVETIYHPVIWRGQEDFFLKLDRLTKLIDEKTKSGRKISLVGVSAGATAAFNAYTARPDKVSRVVYICGKLRRPQSVGSDYYQKNLAFKQSLAKVARDTEQLTQSDGLKMLSLHPIYDNVVPVADTRLPYVKSKTVLAIFHIPGIFVSIIFYVPLIIKFIKGAE